MILDIMGKADRYLPLHQRFQKAFAFLMRPDLKELAAGRYDIDGELVYALISKGHGRSREEALLETHERFIDIQLVLAGTDSMGWKPASACIRPAGGYDPERDVRFFSDEPDSWVIVNSGAFAVFFPDDAHMPLISPGHVHKVVIKVAEDRSCQA